MNIEATDEELASRVRRSRLEADQAFGMLHERHALRLLAFLRGRVERAGDVDDIHQEVWMRVWRGLMTRFQGGNFRAWLFEIARNCGLDWTRKRRRPGESGVPSDDETIPTDWSRPGIGQTIPEHEEVERRRSILRRGLDILGRDNPEAATVVRGRAAGHSYERIAQDLGLTAERARKLFCQAKDYLRSCAEAAPS